MLPEKMAVMECFADTTRMRIDVHGKVRDACRSFQHPRVFRCLGRVGAPSEWSVIFDQNRRHGHGM